jgi:hypothetical protein
MNDTRSTNRGRRILVRIAVVLCLLLAAGVLPMAAFAAPTTVSDVEATYLNTATINLMATVVPGANPLQTYYQLDGGAQAAGASATTSIYGAHVLEFWSTDQSGVEAPVTAPFFVDDSVLPVVASDCEASYTTTATIEITATDNFNGSGVDFLCYRVDGGAISTVFPPASVQAAKLLFAGIAAIKVSGVQALAPVDPSLTPPHVDRGACVNCHTLITPTPTPTPTPTGTPAPEGSVSSKVVVTGAGTHTLEYWAQDIARNATTHVVKTFAIADTFTITPTSGANGSILPSTAQTVSSGGNLTFTITPATGYSVADVLVDGSSVGQVTSYAFNNVTAAHTISATFAKRVSWNVTLKLSKSSAKVNTKVKYSATVRTSTGRAGSGVVTIQKRRASGGSWIKWKTHRLNASGNYSITVKMTKRQTSFFRAKMPGNAANRTGYSAKRKLRVY